MKAHGVAIVESTTSRSSGARRARRDDDAARAPSRSWARTSGLVNVSAKTKRVSGRIAAASAAWSPSSTIVTDAADAARRASSR